MSRLPEIIDALVQRWTTDPDLAEARVLDGPQVTDSAAQDWVMVGYDGGDSGSFQAATVEQDWAGMTALREERIALTVAVVACRGDTDVKAARDRVYEMAAVLAASLRADPSAGLPQMQIAIGSNVLHQEQTPDGIQARLIITLTCNTFA